MPTVLFRPTKSTYVSNIEKCANYYTLNYLSLACYSKKCTFIKDTVLIKFDFSLLEDAEEDDDITIRNASLILPLNQTYLNKCALYKGIDLFAITEKVCFPDVTWETVPKAKYITTSYLTRDVIDEKYITFDITDLVIQWVNSCIPNYGIILCNNACDSIIISPKDSLTSPVVEVDYVNDEDKCPNKCNSICDALCDSPTLELQLNDLPGGLIDPLERIIFNDIIFQSSDDISYNRENGEILITKKGVYSFHLTINVENFNNICPIAISLKNLTKNTYINFHIPPEPHGHLAGTAVIDITEPLERFIVVNNSTSTIQLSDTDVQSTLIVSHV